MSWATNSIKADAEAVLYLSNHKPLQLMAYRQFRSLFQKLLFLQVQHKIDTQDTNNSNHLRHDPIYKLACERLPLPVTVS
jgi:hypothetical protein